MKIRWELISTSLLERLQVKHNVILAMQNNIHVPMMLCVKILYLWDFAYSLKGTFVNEDGSCQEYEIEWTFNSNIKMIECDNQNLPMVFNTSLKCCYYTCQV